MKKVTILAALAAVALAGSVRADVLWDQSDYDAFGAGFFNSVSGGPPFGITQYVVSDVVVPAAGWHIESITTYYGLIDPFWGTAISEGHVHVFAKTGARPVDGTDDPTLSVLVPMTGTDIGGVWSVSASGLHISLPAGEYWIGITPVAPSGPFGPEIHMGTVAFVGAATASYDPFAFPGPPAWFDFNPGVDASIKIEGSRPTSVDPTSWTRVKSLYR
jgi:hypothetical protein